MWNSIRFFLLVLTILTSTACTVARMQVAPSLASATPMDVTGSNPRVWNRPIGFGPFQSSEVQEGMKWGFSIPLLGIDASYRSQPYRLVLQSPSGPIQAECVTRSAELSRSGFALDPTLGRMPVLGCGFRSGDDEWTMGLLEQAPGRRGEIRGDTPWTIRSVLVSERSPISSSEPLGYEILRDGDVIGAVEVINRGRVWMAPSLEGRDQQRLAAAAAALLLFRDPAE
jgi:hypothetical protein